MAGIEQLREIRIRTGTTFNKTFTNAATDSWNVDNSTKTRVVSIDDSGLEQPGLVDETLQTRRYAKNAPYPGLRKGSLKFATYAAGAATSNAQGILGDLLHVAMGGLVSPISATRATTVDAGSGVSNFNLVDANTYVVAGQAVLLGAKGDARGDGRVKIITTSDNGGASYWPNAEGAPADGDAVVASTTGFVDETATKRYADFLMIGDDTNDQRQAIGGSLTYTITGTAPGELPKVEFDCTVADHQYVPTGDQATANDTYTPAGNNPAHERAIGLFHLEDALDSASTSRQAGDFTIESGLTVAEIPEPGGVNGIGGHKIMPSQASVEATVLFSEDMLAFAEDANARTDKCIIAQFGHTAGRCFAMDMQKCHFDSMPVRNEINGLTGVKVKLMSNEDINAGTTEVNRAAYRIHMF